MRAKPEHGLKSQPATHAWVGLDQDGEARAMCFDDPGYEQDVALWCAEQERYGRRLERMPLAEARALMGVPAAEADK